MKIEKIRSKAKQQSAAQGKLSKIGQIRMVQLEEGNFDCFATAFDGVCDQANCLWRKDCFEAAQSGEPS